MIHLNLGCGGRPLEGYINVDSDTLENLKVRYPTYKFPEDVKIYQFDIFNLPLKDGTVDEIRADSLIEHLSFAEESKFLYEVKRVLKPSGLFIFSVPDFIYIVKKWLHAEDDWKDFYRCDEEAIKSGHWFGQYSWELDQRWGYLTACLFGPQNSEGQFHKNCYTIQKIKAMLKRLNFTVKKLSYFYWKNTKVRMIQVEAIKNA